MSYRATGADGGRFLRALESGAALAGLAALAPVLAIIAAAVAVTSRGPVFHLADRVGRDGKRFRLYKFRTMTGNAASSGPGITRSADPRVTRLGRILRKFKLDEWPQLINVLKGEMRFVGPRPEDPRYVALYSEDERRILAFPPGITSAASVRYRGEESLLTGERWEETYRTVILPDKIRLDLEYMGQRTFASDLRLLGETLRSVLGSGGDGPERARAAAGGRVRPT